MAGTSTPYKTDGGHLRASHASVPGAQQYQKQPPVSARAASTINVT
jgi:hypothetical protein